MQLSLQSITRKETDIWQASLDFGGNIYHIWACCSDPFTKQPKVANFGWKLKQEKQQDLGCTVCCSVTWAFGLADLMVLEEFVTEMFYEASKEVAQHSPFGC